MVPFTWVHFLTHSQAIASLRQWVSLVVVSGVLLFCFVGEGCFVVCLFFEGGGGGAWVCFLFVCVFVFWPGCSVPSKFVGNRGCNPLISPP